MAIERIEKSIVVNAPIQTVYNQWTQFEEFPRFMEGVEGVSQLDDKRLHWIAEIGGKRKEWDAEIVEQAKDSRISWHSTSGPWNAGSVLFNQDGMDRTRITLRMEYEPDTLLEKFGANIGVVSGRVEGDLRRFKEFIEKRGAETGAWRGEIHQGEVESR